MSKLKIKNIMANADGSNAKLDGLVQWSPVDPDDLTMSKTKKSCKDAGCQFLSVKDGGKAGLYKIVTGHRLGDYISKKETRVRIRASAEVSEVRETLDGSEVEKVPGCFAWLGMIQASTITKIKTAQRGKDYSLESGLMGLRKAHKYVRGAVIGNASTFYSPEEMETIDSMVRAEGVGHIIYDHAWKDNPWILKFACASANDVSEVQYALAMGAAVVTVALPKDKAHEYKATPNAGKVVICPESRGIMSCNSCGLCDAQERRAKMQKGQKPLVIVFYTHESGSHKQSNATRVRNICKWLGLSLRQWEMKDQEERRKLLLGLYRSARADKRTRKAGRTLPTAKTVAGAFFWFTREDIE